MSPTLFGLCINKLEETLLKVMHKEGISSLHIGMYVILLLLYADAVFFFTHIEEHMPREWVESECIQNKAYGYVHQAIKDPTKSTLCKTTHRGCIHFQISRD